MNTHPRVSVVVPAFNQGDYIAEAIDSALGQTIPPFEVIVVDDGSTDQTAEVCASYGDRISYVHQPNAGAGAARNRGLSMATGDFIAFLDSDDIWPADRLALQLEAFAADPQLEHAFGQQQRFDTTGPLSPPVPGILAGTYMGRADAVRRLGPFDTTLRAGEFIDWYARAAELGMKEIVLPRLLLHRRSHGRNSTNSTANPFAEYAVALKMILDRRRALSSRP